MTSATLHDRLRAGAAGIYADQAAVELLIRANLAYDRAPWITTSRDMAWIDPHRLIDDSGPLSGGEQRIIRIAASLLSGEGVDLSDALSSLDRRHSMLVLAAIAHAMGSHEYSDLVMHGDGTASIVMLDPLYHWPDEERSRHTPAGPPAIAKTTRASVAAEPRRNHDHHRDL